MKKSLCLATLLLVPTTNLLAPPAQAEQLTAAMNECRQQQNALKRLVCYDEIKLTATDAPVAQAKQPQSPQSQQPVATSKRPTAEQTAAPAQSDFGLEHKQTADKQADQLYLTVSDVSYSPRKELIVAFDNGQTWRQTGTDYYKIAVGERHYIKRGMLNSFTLGSDANNRTIKVRRVQ